MPEDRHTGNAGNSQVPTGCQRPNRASGRVGSSSRCRAPAHQRNNLGSETHPIIAESLFLGRLPRNAGKE